MVFWPVMDALGFSNEVFAGGWSTDVKLERGCAWLIRPIGINAKPAGRNFFVNQALRKFICAIVLNKVFFHFYQLFSMAIWWFFKVKRTNCALQLWQIFGIKNNNEGPKKLNIWHPFHRYNLCAFQPYKIKKYFWILGWRNACIWVWIKIKYFWILGSRNACIWVWIKTLYKMKDNLEIQPRWGQKISHPWIRKEFYVKLLEHLGKIFLFVWHLFCLFVFVLFLDFYFPKVD